MSSGELTELKVLMFFSFRTCLSTVNQFGNTGTTLIQKLVLKVPKLVSYILKHLGTLKMRRLFQKFDKIHF